MGVHSIALLLVLLGASHLASAVRVGWQNQQREAGSEQQSIDALTMGGSSLHGRRLGSYDYPSPPSYTPGYPPAWSDGWGSSGVWDGHRRSLSTLEEVQWMLNGDGFDEHQNARHLTEWLPPGYYGPSPPPVYGPDDPWASWGRKLQQFDDSVWDDQDGAGSPGGYYPPGPYNSGPPCPHYGSPPPVDETTLRRLLHSSDSAAEVLQAVRSVALVREQQQQQQQQQQLLMLDVPHGVELRIENGRRLAEWYDEPLGAYTAPPPSYTPTYPPAPATDDVWSTLRRNLLQDEVYPSPSPCGTYGYYNCGPPPAGGGDLADWPEHESYSRKLQELRLQLLQE